MRVALATVGTTGDVRPFAALARGLVEAGHAVTAISWEIHRDPFEAAGAAFQAAGPATSREEIATTAARAAAAGTPLAQVAVLRDFHLRGAVEHYAALRRHLAGHDLVVLHGIHSLAEAAARDAERRWATAVFDPVLLPTGTAPPAGMPSLGPFNRAGWWLVDRMLRRQDGPLSTALESAGSPSARTVTMFRARSPLLHLVACSPTIVPPPADVSPTTHFTGAWTAAGPPDHLPEAVTAFLDAGPAPVAISFGSMAAPDPEALIGAAVEGVRLAEPRAIVQTTTGSGAPWGRGVLVAGDLDHRALFPRAAAVIHHGGAGTTHAAVAAGVPSVVVPHVGDQRYWATRLHRLRVAAAPIAVTRLTPERIRDAIHAVSAAVVRERATELQRSVAAEQGVPAAIRLLEAIAPP